jgi:hypothetical protein
VVTVGVFGVESLDASSSPPERVNRSELSSEIAEEDVSSSSITLVGGRHGVDQDRVYGEVQKSLKLTMLCAMTCKIYFNV